MAGTLGPPDGGEKKPNLVYGWLHMYMQAENVPLMNYTAPLTSGLQQLGEILPKSKSFRWYITS